MESEDMYAISKSKRETFQCSNKTRAAKNYAYIDEQIGQNTRGNKKVLKRHENALCLAKAVQKHMVSLVDKMPFNESSIPDELIAEGCITEDECKRVREKKERKEQVRKVVLLIRGRSFPVLKKFLNILEREHNCPTVVAAIWDSFEELDKTNCISQKCCGVCSLKTHVDIRYVIDKLWEEEAISDILYEQMSEVTELKGSQSNSWDTLLHECTTKNTIDILISALNTKGHYSHIAKELRTQIKLGSGTQCACLYQEFKSPGRESPDSASSCLPYSSYSNSVSSLAHVQSEDSEIENGSKHEQNPSKDKFDLQADQIFLPDFKKPKDTEKAVKMGGCFPVLRFLFQKIPKL